MKDHWKEFLILLLFVLLIFSGCPIKCNKGNQEIKRDTVTVTKTEYIKQPPVYLKEYVPVEASSVKPSVIPKKYTASQDADSLLAQYNDIIEKYFTLHTYNDSVQLADSSGRNVGMVFLKDEISENKFKSRKPSYQLNFPVTTTTQTITITQPCDPARQVYFGGEISGNLSSPVNGASAGVLFKNKKDRIYGLTAGIVTVNATVYPQFSIMSYWKIKIR